MIDNLSNITNEETYQCKILKNDTVKINTLNPDTYRMLRNDTALHSTALQHYEAPAYQTDQIQAAIIQIKAQPWPFNIATMYSPPRHKIEAEDYKNFSITLETNL